MAAPEPTAPPITAVPPTAQPAPEPTGEISDIEAEADMLNLDALTSHSWQWTSFTSPVEEVRVETPERYLLTFNAAGAVNIVADCNNAAGSYTSQAGSLTIEIGPMTLAACPPESRSDQFVALLGSAARYFLADGNLHIDLMADGGTMTFAPASTTMSDGSAAAELAGILGNLTYNGVLPDEPITLADGLGSYEDGGATSPFVRLADSLIAVGDLNGDGAEDAAAFLVDNSAGSGNFVYLVAVLNVRTEPAPLEALLLGDRTPVRSLTITGEQITAELMTHGPDDPMCCPTLMMRQSVGVVDGRLAETSREELGTVTLADMNGTSWRLVNLNWDQEPALPETEITLRFDDGQISGSAGCNNYSSGVTTGEGGLPQSLAFSPVAATQMLCADDIANQEAAYLDRLAKVVAWRYDFGRLSLTYKQDDGVLGELLFAPQEL